MKYIGWVLGLVLSAVVLLYIVAFTAFGNNLVKPLLESKLQENTKLPLKVDVFKLTTNYIELTLLLNEKNSLHVDGKYSLFSQIFDIYYSCKFNELQTLSSLTKKELHGSFHTSGDVKGNPEFMKIDGMSDVAKSDTYYHIELTKFDPTSIIAKIKHARLEEFLALMGEKSYASAGIDLDLNFKNIKPHRLDGDMTLHVGDSKIDYELMKKEFGVGLPKTEFSMDAKARLKGDEALYMYEFKSNLANIQSKGIVTPSPLALDLTYNINVKELALLRPILKAPLRGKIDIEGNVKGTKENLHVRGKSDIASSKTVFDAELADFTPKQVNADIKNLNLSKFLYMVSQPHYADASVDVRMNIKDLSSLEGNVVTEIKKGVLDVNYLSKSYGLKDMPKVNFSAKTDSKLSKNSIDTGIALTSNLMTLAVNKASYNVKNQSIDTDYKIKLPDLGKLFFITKRDLKGAMAVEGRLQKEKDLDIKAHTDIFGGKVDAILHNDDLRADLSDVRTLPILEMLTYPQIFDSSLGGRFEYNIAKKSGKLDAKLTDGHFVNTQMINLVKQYTKTDLYKEKFLGRLSAGIDQENIVASLHLNSNNAKIDTKNLKLNSNTKHLEATIRVEANQNPLTLILKGEMSHPRITIDATELIEKEAGKAINKEINKFLKGLF
ncbi:hypothetical protein KKA17_01805 [bacterium]|nr:hypothetical protein [bacterium]MBU1882716.1 hypothetical protein [bacterium]